MKDPHLLPSSSAVECVYLESPENGEVTQTGTLVGSVAIYSCFPGFELVGEETRTCQENGQWSGTEPFCRRECTMGLILAS